jgi:hypothetical protein
MNENEVNQNAFEEKIDIDLGSEDTFFVASNGNYFGIAFDKLFGQPQLNVYNTFEMSSKRNFKNLCAMILETYNELFLDEEGDLRDESEFIFFQILKAKSDIMVAPFTTYEKFVEYMENIIEGGDGLLLSIIDDFVNENYSLNLDKITEQTKEKKRKVNLELQFTDNHAKELLKIAYLYRVMIPIISIYFYYNKGTFNSANKTAENETSEILSVEEMAEMEFDEVNASIFAYLFEKFAENPDALRNKLYRLTYSGVSKTAYSDKRFWLAAKNVAITEKTEALEIYKKLLTNAIPKLSIEGDKNVVSFLQSVINNQVDFLFQNKFKFHFIPLGNTESSFSSSTDDDDSGVSEFERVEIQQSRKDEGRYLIRKLNIKEVIESIPEKMNVGVSDAEVKDAMSKIKRNAIQEEIIALLTFKYFNDKDALKFVSFYQYCYLLIACKKYLLNQKYVYLPLILTSNCEKHRERVNISGKKVRPEILNSKKYKDIIAEKYPNFSEEIERPFLSIIGTIYSSVFKNENGEEIFDSTVKVGKIAEEIVNLMKLV